MKRAEFAKNDIIMEIGGDCKYVVSKYNPQGGRYVLRNISMCGPSFTGGRKYVDQRFVKVGEYDGFLCRELEEGEDATQL